MPVLIVIAILAVLAAVVLVASGRWGEMPASERGDYAPLDMGPVSATDVVLLRPPTALWGYNQQATDEALERIAESIRERDVRIVALEQLVTDLSRMPAPAPPVPLGSPYVGARHAKAKAGSAQRDLAPDITPPDGNSMPPDTTPAPSVPPPGDEHGLLGAPVADQGEEPTGAPPPGAQGGLPEVSHD